MKKTTAETTTTNSTIRTRWVSPLEPKWMPPTDVAGIEQLPVLPRYEFNTDPTTMVSFIRADVRTDTSTTLLHGYVSDDRLRAIERDPSRYLAKFSQFQAVITPDHSIRRGMPPHARTRAAWIGRAIGSFYSHHGLNVIPNVRWAQIEDLDVVLCGLPVESTIAISMQGLARDPEVLQTLIDGMPIVMNQLRPSTVVTYGVLPQWFKELIPNQTRILNFPTDISLVHGSRNL